MWTYDVPVGGTSMTLEQIVPFSTMEYQVVSDYVDGMSLEVEGFQVARVHEGGDRRFLVAGLMRRPGDPPIDRLRIHIRGHSGLGTVALSRRPWSRWFSRFWGFRSSCGRPIQTEAIGKLREERRKELLDEIAELEGQRTAELIGPSFYEHRRRELTDELAIVLRMQSEATGH